MSTHSDSSRSSAAVMKPAWFTVPVTLQPMLAPVTTWKKHDAIGTPAR